MARNWLARFFTTHLTKKYTSLKASLIIGFVWGLWHLPIYLALNPYGNKTIIFFILIFIGCFAISIIATFFYNSTGSSLFICILFHNSINTSAAYFCGNLKGAEFRPFIIWILLLSVIAISLISKSNNTLILGLKNFTTFI